MLEFDVKTSFLRASVPPKNRWQKQFDGTKKKFWKLVYFWQNKETNQSLHFKFAEKQKHVLNEKNFPEEKKNSITH